MKVHRVIAAAWLAIAFLAAASAEAFAGAEYGWKGSSYVKDEEKGYEIKFGGRIFMDWTGVNADDELKSAYPDITDGTEFRTLRLFSEGKIYKIVEYKAQLDFLYETTALKDVWIGLLKVPVVGGIRVGQQKEVFGLEELTSSKRITFMERALTQAFVPGRNIGVLVGRELGNKKATVKAGVFRNSGDTVKYQGNKYNFTGRVTVAPVYDEDEGRLLHLGAAGTYRAAEENSAGTKVLRYRVRPDNHLSPYFVDTGSFEAESAVHVGGEVATVFGPASLQGEYMIATTDAPEVGDPSFSAFYVYGSYFITGEHRGYKAGEMDTPQPKSTFDGEGGWGAWELAARFDMVDLTDADIAGGEEQNITAGLNWYLNRYTRVMLNYVYADVEDVGAAHQLLARFQVEF